MGGSRRPAIHPSQDRIFLSGKSGPEEPVFRGYLAQRIPEETPAAGGKQGLTVLP